MNGVINTFIELEKLTLSRKKCNNVHIGKSENECHPLKVHGTQMNQSTQETYLGDKIDKSALLKPTLASRISKGYGAVTYILSILKELPLGHWRVEAGLRLREALFINGTLFNSEAWQGIQDKDIEGLEKVDETLLKGILGAHTNIPKEALFLETGTIPLRFIIKSRRLSYLKTILDRDPDELIKEVYNAQKADPTPGDFADLVTKDAEEVLMDISNESEIESAKKETYKSKVKQKVKEAGFTYLKKLKTSHSKMENLNYENLELSQYMKSPMFDHQSVKMLLALRTRTVRNIKNDFRGMFQDVLCPLGCSHTDTIPNILICPAIRAHIQTNETARGTIKYDDIFSTDVIKQKQVTALYTMCLEIRETLLQSSPVAAIITGPVH